MSKTTAGNAQERTCRDGILFVVSAPSGAGKSSLCQELIQAVPQLQHSVSYATRAIRGAEIDGVDYHFVAEEQFRQMVDDDAFAEWAQVHGNYYGTARKTLTEAQASGVDLLLDIDYQGAAQLKMNAAHGVFIFILPPDMVELERRLRSRATDGESDIVRRLNNGYEEIRQASWYDYLVVNDDFSRAKDDLLSIILAERNKTVYNKHLLDAYSSPAEKGV